MVASSYIIVSTGWRGVNWRHLGGVAASAEKHHRRAVAGEKIFWWRRHFVVAGVAAGLATYGVARKDRRIKKPPLLLQHGAWRREVSDQKALIE